MCFARPFPHNQKKTSPKTKQNEPRDLNPESRKQGVQLRKNLAAAEEEGRAFEALASAATPQVPSPHALNPESLVSGIPVSAGASGGGGGGGARFRGSGGNTPGTFTR